MKRKNKKGHSVVESCLSKKRLDNENDAIAQAIWQSEQNGLEKSSAQLTFDYYKCTFCEGYHTYKV